MRGHQSFTKLIGILGGLERVWLGRGKFFSFLIQLKIIKTINFIIISLKILII